MLMWVVHYLVPEAAGTQLYIVVTTLQLYTYSHIDVLKVFIEVVVVVYRKK